MTVEQTTAFRPTPGILVAKPRRDRKHPRLGGYVLYGLIALGGVVAVVWEVATGMQYVVRFWGVLELPAVVIYAVAVLAGVGGLVATWRKPLAPWYQPWSLVEFAEEPGGLRVLAGRNGVEGFLVRPGEVLRVDVEGRRQGSAKVYELIVSASTGEHRMTVGSRLHTLTMTPLVEAARAHGIDVVRYGDAGEIEHPEPREG
ncbi:hypothetical protein [Actinotalea fermentans]|uniref:Uncharacterized protein n=1 Tax=Actinotalea fermentans TaxID=43671 RepID=A0A511YVL9_9CELL|nr:hypothetical protein [Actinotalea fermentans]KGM16681.1 hypothetical protein N867_17200 [Actinotalea fermentans ATCC 43279 = JCM 9966 = DSM 3133]GEN79219.1 hypothetical protein AFE02nite_09530 [Actinotalea fermentans]